MAEQLELERIGPQHQAGSDSLLTGMAFFKMREVGSPGQSRERAGAFHSDGTVVSDLTLTLTLNPLQPSVSLTFHPR